MVREANIIHVEPDSELGRLLDQANGTPVYLEKDGVQYVLSREEEERAEMSNEEYQRILDETVGSLSREEGERMLAAIYRARREGAYPENRP